MKFVLLAALTLLPTLAHAGFVCTSTENGIAVRETKNGNAEVVFKGPEGVRVISTMECFIPEGDGRGGNVPHVTLTCNDNKMGGYSFQMSSGGVVGISAYLSRNGMGVRAQFLSCSWN